ncbi:hypothetical protein [Sphingomonas sanguinis]|jgi:hypothetical protein|uniref:Lipoprotein n=2 Tax=Sphingomonas sanguinis TaxID=33051 RepID=A0A7Y7USQ7_9SPHN|nr:hypothetical protein [Sphingomonas sanguinis]MBZ6382918.1 hypothetical protein [Sphingomonas sanguinis]NNG51499.1 hypothetical protein [Sphingomonas sanguinis]NNG52472.1 hypothetical protein [Sphingomonas sanguinis]NVP32218.1 hypothetical protein [Sphingomonas sanguinis]
MRRMLPTLLSCAMLNACGGGSATTGGPSSVTVVTAPAEVVPTPTPTATPTPTPATADTTTFAQTEAISAIPVGDVLRWAPPTLTKEKVVDLRSVAHLEASYKFPYDQDLRILLPTNRAVEEPLQIIGGRNIVLMGGEIHVPSVKPYAASTSFAKGDMVVLSTGSFAMYQAVTGGKTGASSTPSGTGSSIADGTVTWRYVGLHPRAALKFSGQPSGSTTFIEGVKIDLAQSYGYDAIEIGGWDQATPGPDYTIQNVRLLGAMSTTSGLHADLVQFYGSCRNLRIDKLTGTSQYQGLFLSPQHLLGSVELHRVDLRYIDPTAQSGYLLWLFDDQNQKRQPVLLDQVYVGTSSWSYKAGMVQEQVVWPASNKIPWNKLGGAVLKGNVLTWPTIPEISGSALVGQPLVGQFVREGAAGLNYRSPGYRGL